METHDSVVSMTEAYAHKAVIIAREFNARLDYSENSLMELEGILSQLALDLPPGGPSTDELTEMCKMWGCYFGEVVRRRFGGDWSIDTYPGKQFATLTQQAEARLRGAGLRRCFGRPQRRAPVQESHGPGRPGP